jgi:hypothetical protein
MSGFMHWTYQLIEDKNSDLQQGDILLPNEGLKNLFHKVHPHFIDSKYNGFLILTQTCDLVRRDGKCKSRYVNLAVIRPLDEVLFTLLNNSCNPVVYKDRIIEGAYTKESKWKAQQLLERIMNQNEQTLGIFYLHPDSDVGIAVASVAMLQVSIAVYAKEHYSVLVDSRQGRIDKEFQSKLGWLTGNLYARVATRDWPNEERDKFVREYLPKDCWIPQENINMVKRQSTSDDLGDAQILEKLANCKPVPKLDIAIEQIESTVRDEVDGISHETIKNISGKLKANLQFTAVLK